MRYIAVVVLALALLAGGCAVTRDYTQHGPSRGGSFALGALLGAAAVIVGGIVVIKQVADSVPDLSGLEQGHCGSGCH